VTPARLGFPYEDPDARLASACASFLAGKLARCVASCRKAARSADASLRFEAALLWARALIRLGRNDDAVAVLDATDAGGDPRGGVVAMLRGTARMRLGEADGVRELERLVADGLDTPGAVEAVLEMTRIDLRDTDHVTAGARLAALPVPFGPIGARVLEHRGFVAFSGSRYDDALEAWRASLEMFAACGVFDQLIAANIAFATCIIAVERIDPALWERAQRLVARCTFLRRGPTITAHQLHYVASLWHDLYGRPMDALVSARNAEAFAPTPLERVAARCARAAVFFHYGERLACADACSTIRADFAALEVPGVVCNVEDDSVSEIAETLATIGDADGAIAALARRGNTVFLNSTTRAGDRHVQSLVADAVGETFKARHLLEQAFWEWRGLGNRRRALLAALRLLEIGPHPDASAYADDITRSLPPESWARAAYVRLTRNLPASQSVSLNRAQRDVLDMLVRGMSTAEIAKARRRSQGTTRNTVSSLLRAFGVPTRQALLSEHMRRTSPADEHTEGGRVRLFS
jgi:DNA-binding CsgD family transcriptional regulator